jgi:hypothetical protein
MCVYKCRKVGLSGILSVRYRNEKTNDAGTRPVLDQAIKSGIFSVWYRTEFMNADACVSLLDADDHLCKQV